jgi:lysophospholipase L1-like esterase
MQSYYRYLSTNDSWQIWSLICFLLATFESAASAQIAAEIPSKALEAMQLRTPAWKSPTVHRESSILLQDGQAVPTARLAFPASEIIELRTAMTGKVFQEGIDWKLDATKSTIQWVGLLPCETIRTDQLFPPSSAPNSYKHRASNPDQNLLYAPGKWFHERNIEITYRRANPVESSEGATEIHFPKSLEKLRRKSKLVIAVSGDSISTGLDASATTATPPNQPGYPDLLAAQLRHDFGAEITLVNRSVAGWSIANGVEDLDKLVECKPDLLIVAYGMNDVGRRDPKWFVDQADKIRQRAKTLVPDVEILWVTTMLGNREWIHTPRDMFFAYQKALRDALPDASAHEAIADVTRVWEIMSERKHELDFTGNGLNHPNDFGHRLYAQCILEFLPAESLPVK